MNEEHVSIETTATSTVSTTSRTCPKCNHALQENQKFCPACGTEYVPPKPTFCHNCGTEIPESCDFCPNCGSRKLDVPSTEDQPKEKKKKKWLLPTLISVGAVLLIATAVILFFALRKPENSNSIFDHTVSVTGLQLSSTSVELTEEETTNVSCTVLPENATDQSVTWTSSDEKIATVDQYGKITAVSKGSCTITAKSGDISTTVSITVKKKLPDLKALYDEYCSSTWASLGSDYSYLSVDTNPYNYDNGDYRFYNTVNDAIEDIHRSMGLPDSLREDMGKTSWSMGKQEEVFENIGIKVTWTYHPDKGLEVTYKLITN